MHHPLPAFFFGFYYIIVRRYTANLYRNDLKLEFYTPRSPYNYITYTPVLHSYTEQITIILVFFFLFLSQSSKRAIILKSYFRGNDRFKTVFYFRPGTAAR